MAKVTITAKAREALARLRGMQPFQVTPATRDRQVRGKWGLRTVTGSDAHIRTGINTAILHSLRNAGLIDCTTIYLEGRVTPDLQVVGEVAEAMATTAGGARTARAATPAPAKRQRTPRETTYPPIPGWSDFCAALGTRCTYTARGVQCDNGVTTGNRCDKHQGVK